jgi:DNA-binding CsgD family transcriptional regulator
VAVVCPRLIGRVAELNELTTRLDEVERGRGGLVVVTGPAGIGKSRLLAGLVAQARDRGHRVLVGRAVPEGADVAFRSLADAFLGVDLPTEESLRPWSGLLTGILPGFAVQGLSPSTAVSAEATPAARAEALLRLLRSLAREAPVLLALEDQHWADPDTLAVVEHLGSHLDVEPVLLVATVRDEESLTPASVSAGTRSVADRLGSHGVGVQITLDRLSPAEVAEMVLACGGVTDEITERVVSLSEGVPFLVEEFLASQGRMPRSFGEMVAGRLAALAEPEARVVHAAALLGQSHDWSLLARVSDCDEDAVGLALDAAQRVGLLQVVDGGHAFRHALTREAIINQRPQLLGRDLASKALAVLEAGHGTASAELTAELAEVAGDRDRAAELHTRVGRTALQRGALTTAAAALERAAELADDVVLLGAVLALLMEVYATAGRFEECASAGRTLLDLPGVAPAEQAAAHVVMAQACVEADRWSTASTHLVSAQALLEDQAGRADPATGARRHVLTAEVALATRDLRGCEALVDELLGAVDLDPDVRCQALALRGRSLRSRDLDAARSAFEESLAVAVAAGLPLRRLKALHELGTVDLFDHAGTERLEEALRTAEDVGALSTATVLHLQLAAAHVFRFEHDEAISHAVRARASARRLGIGPVAATASVFLAEIAAVTVDPATMETEIEDAEATLPGDPEIAGSAWGARGLAHLFAGDPAAASDPLRRAFQVLTDLPNPGPALYLGLWPLLLAVDGDPGAEAASAAARRAGITVNRGNRGLLGYAGAVELGKTDSATARRLAVEAAGELAAYPVWGDVARLLVAPSARRGGWGEWRAWLESATTTFERHGLAALAARARDTALNRNLAGDLGITAREIDVLKLLAAGLSNKEIAARLVLSARTVEKHVESLLRKTGTRSRTELVASRVGREVAYPAT